MDASLTHALPKALTLTPSRLGSSLLWLLVASVLVGIACSSLGKLYQVALWLCVISYGVIAFKDYRKRCVSRLQFGRTEWQVTLMHTPVPYVVQRCDYISFWCVILTVSLPLQAKTQRAVIWRDSLSRRDFLRLKAMTAYWLP